MSNLTEDISISKRPKIFRGRGAQQRSDAKKKARRNQSTGDISQSAREQLKAQFKDENASSSGKKIPRWLRLLKMTSISATTAITSDALRIENTHHHHHHHHHHQPHKYHQSFDYSNSPPQEMESFLGNLGIGAYVGDEENAFVNSDNSEEINNIDQLNRTSKPLSKSMINLSSVNLWPPKRKTSGQINEPETSLLSDITERCNRLSSSSRVSCLSNASSPPSTSSSPQSTSSLTHSKNKTSHSEITNKTTFDSGGINQLKQTEFYESMPIILKTVINQTSMYNNTIDFTQRYNVIGEEGFISSNLTPKLSTNTITGMNSNYQSVDNITLKRIIHYPAWMIISDDQLQLDTTYSFYRITDYLKELYLAESWLENLLISDTLPSRSYSPVRQPADYRSRRARLENNSINSHKILKRTCSEQRYDETQMVGGSWDRREMDLIQKLIRRAISTIESKESLSRQVDEDESSFTPTLSAVIFKNASSTDRKFPISLRSFIPDCEKIAGNNENTTNWKKIYAEEIVNIVKLPRYPVEQCLNLETIHQSQKSTMFLCSDYLVLTQWPLDSYSLVCNADLAHIIPFYEIWCDTMKLDELLLLYTRTTTTTSAVESIKSTHSNKCNLNVKHADIDNDILMKCNISSSSGISTASLDEDGGDLMHSSSPSSMEHYCNQSINDTEFIRKTTKSYHLSNDHHVYNDTDRLLLIGHPLMENWAIRFANNHLCDKWRYMINASIQRNQQLFTGKSINVKVINQIIPNHQVIYKYHNIPIHMTIDQLKEKALEALNINVNNTKADLYLRYLDTNGEEREILMYGPENPFLIALSSVQMNTTNSLPNATTTTTATFPAYNTTTHISNIIRNHNLDSNVHISKDMLDLIKRVSLSPPSENKTTDSNNNNSSSSHDYLVSRDQVKISFVLRSADKPLPVDDNQAQQQQQRQHHHHHNQMNTKSEIKSTEYVKQDRGRSTSKSSLASGVAAAATSRNRRNDATRDNNNNMMMMMTKSTIFLDHHHHKTNMTKPTSTSTSTTMPLRAAISTSSLQIGGTSQEMQSGQIFGRLPEQCWPDSQLPESLVNLFAIIYYNGVNVEGIFRRTAVHSQIEMMRLRVDENIQTITPNNCNPILASCVLKRFFCEIPGHLLIDSNWDEWASLTEINSATERLQVLEKLIRNLPKVNQTLLALLIYLLAHIRDHEEINRMSARNLAVVWGPNLIQRPNSPLALEDSKIVTQIVTYLLEPTVTNFLLNTSNVKMELNQHFSNIWGNFLQDSNGKTRIQNNAVTLRPTTTTTDSSDDDQDEEDDKRSRQSSAVRSEQKISTKHTSRRGHSVANIPPQINSLEVENLLNNEKFGYSLLMKTSDQVQQHHNESTVLNNNVAPPSSHSINTKSTTYQVNMENSQTHSSKMQRRGAGRIHRKKHSFFNQPALPDQTGPPTTTTTTTTSTGTTRCSVTLLNRPINQNLSSTDSITTEFRNIIRSRTTSTFVLPLSFSVTATTPTNSTSLTTAVEKQEDALKKTTTTTTSSAASSAASASSSRRSRNTSCPPSTNKTINSNDKLSIPCPLPRSQIDSEAPPIPLRGQQLTHQDVGLKHANNNHNDKSHNFSKTNSNRSKSISHHSNNTNSYAREETTMPATTTTTITTASTTASTTTSTTTAASLMSRQRRLFHRRFRPQKSTGEMPDANLLHFDYCTMRHDAELDMNARTNNTATTTTTTTTNTTNNSNNNNNTHGNVINRRRNSMEHQFSYMQSFDESYANDLYIRNRVSTPITTTPVAATTTTTATDINNSSSSGSGKTNEFSKPIKIISVSSNNGENIALKSHKTSSTNPTTDHVTTNNSNIINNRNSHLMKANRSIHSSTDYRSRNINNNNNNNNNTSNPNHTSATNTASMPRSGSDMSMISTDSSLLSSYSSNSSSSSSSAAQCFTRKHPQKITNDLVESITGIPCPVVYRPELNTQHYLTNNARKQKPTQKLITTCQSLSLAHDDEDNNSNNNNNKRLNHPTSQTPLTASVHSTNDSISSSSYISSSSSPSPSPTSLSSSSDVGYATSYHENMENLMHNMTRCMHDTHRPTVGRVSSNVSSGGSSSSSGGTPVSRMSSHASTISSGSVTVISTSVEK
ncbi:unnamed protein product [Schistosoma turkestanicum]|nr:unnamed protein product [Schistosoma turkestanicum]